MFQFTALLNIKNKNAYLSGNKKCSEQLSIKDMYRVAKDTDSLCQTAPYAKWANNLDSIGDFEFRVFRATTVAEVKLLAEAYARSKGCTSMSKGRPTNAANNYVLMI